MLEPIKIRSTENAEDESSESEAEDEESIELVHDSDSEPEADREMKRSGYSTGSDSRNFCPGTFSMNEDISVGINRTAHRWLS